MSIREKVYYATEKFFRVIRLFAPPLDALWGFCKGGYYFFKSIRTSQSYFWPKDSLEHNQGDRFGKRLSATAGFSRLGAIALATFCVLGFMGALAVPFPGVAPLYLAGLSVLAKVQVVSKIVLIGFGWTCLGRLGGSIIGSVIDFFKTKPKVAKKPASDMPTQPKLKTTTSHLIKGFTLNALAVGLIGERGPHIISRHKANGSLLKKNPKIIETLGSKISALGEPLPSEAHITFNEKTSCSNSKNHQKEISSFKSPIEPKNQNHSENSSRSIVRRPKIQAQVHSESSSPQTSSRKPSI